MFTGKPNGYLGLYKTSTMGIFAKMVNGFQQLTIFTKKKDVTYLFAQKNFITDISWA